MTIGLFVILCILQFGFCVYHSGLCGNTSKSCIHQLWPEGSKSRDACQMRYYQKDSDECRNKPFTNNYNPYDFGYVKLEPFVDHSRTAFNISFYNIQWTTLKMRFNGEDDLSMCRDFYITETEILSPNSILYYDCPFSTARHESTTMEFNYDYGHEDNLVSKRFVMSVPKHESVDEAELNKFSLFTYVDKSNPDELILRIKKAPKHLDVTAYEVRVMLTKNDQTERCIETNISNYTSIYGELHFRYKTNGIHGKYVFEITYCNKFSCNRTKTPGILIPKNTTPQQIAIVSISTTLILILLFIVYICKQQYIREGELFREQQQILLVYSRSSDAHVEVVKTIANFLKDVYKTNVLIDIYHVPYTKTKDPFIWLQDAFSCATHVVFLLSPAQTDVPKTIYKDVDHLAMQLLKQELGKPSTSKSFSVLIFPYSQTPVPKELMNLKHFYFNKDFEKFLSFLFRRNFWEKLEECVHMLKPEVYEPVRDAVAVAEKAINNGNCADEKVDMPKFVPQHDEPTITRPQSKLVRNEEDYGDHPFFYDIQRILSEESKSDSDVPDDEYMSFNVRDLNLDGD